jgi:hypothetical protein
MKQLINETFNILQKTYTSKAGKSFLLVYVDPKSSTDSTFDAKEKFKEYGMQYLPSIIKSQYIPHAWGWVLWDGENDKQMNLVKKFMNDLPELETAPESGTRGFDEISSNLNETLREMLRDFKVVEGITAKNVLDAEAKDRIERFKGMLQKGLGNPETQEFVKSIARYRNELRKHNLRSLSWSNMVLIYFARQGKATEVRPLKQWESMGYKPKQGVQPIGLIGKGYKYKAYTPEEKEKKIADYLAKVGVNSIEELPPSAKYDLEKRILKGRPIAGTEYAYTYAAYDRMDVEPSGDKPVEKMPEEPDDNWWWDKLPKDEKDETLTQALIEFAQSDECGRIIVKADNTQEGLGGARGNATSTGQINLIDDAYMRFPTGVHELLHSLRHFEYASTNNPALKKFYNRSVDRAVREHEAELCATFVIEDYGYNVQPHLNYLTSWQLDKTNCSKVFDDIAAVADFIDKGVKKYLAKMAIENNNQQNI